MCLACLGILGVDGDSFTLAYADPERVMLRVTDEHSAQLEDLQEVVGEGPSYSACDERSIQTWSSTGLLTSAGHCSAKR